MSWGAHITRVMAFTRTRILYYAHKNLATDERSICMKHRKIVTAIICLISIIIFSEQSLAASVTYSCGPIYMEYTPSNKSITKSSYQTWSSVKNQCTRLVYSPNDAPYGYHKSRAVDIGGSYLSSRATIYQNANTPLSLNATGQSCNEVFIRLYNAYYLASGDTSHYMATDGNLSGTAS